LGLFREIAGVRIGSGAQEIPILSFAERRVARIDVAAAELPVSESDRGLLAFCFLVSCDRLNVPDCQVSYLDVSVPFFKRSADVGPITPAGDLVGPFNFVCRHSSVGRATLS
jgi:hypothetical protein